MSFLIKLQASIHPVALMQMNTVKIKVTMMIIKRVGEAWGEALKSHVTKISVFIGQNQKFVKKC